MRRRTNTRPWRVLTGALLACAGLLCLPAPGAIAFNPIVPTKAGETVTLNGARMSVEDVVDIARHGARVDLSEAARRRSEAAYQLVLEGARQGVPVYGFNRGSGARREEVIFEGDPLSDENRDTLLAQQLATARAGARERGGQGGGIGPEVADEEIIRAQMAVTANRMRYAPATRAVTQMLLDMLNARIAPVVLSRGSPGEGDLPMDANVRAAMVGAGDVYYQGKRMPALEALARAGLQPLTASPDSLGVYVGWPHNGYTDGQTALLVHDTKAMLDWSDLVFAMSMLGMNSSVTPLTAVPQQARPFPYQNWQAQRLINLLWGSYLFELEPDGHRLLQDPLSFRDYSQRNGAIWQAYRQLKHDLLIQINSDSRNPVVLPGARPTDSRELSTPWVRRYYVSGEGLRGGFILSSSNFNNTTLNNDTESLVIALAQGHAGTTQRVRRFLDVFFTVITPSEVLSAEQLRMAAPQGSGYTTSDLMAELQTLVNPVPAQGNPLEQNVEDMEGFGRLKVARARLAVDDALYLVGQELLSASRWMNIRDLQRPGRSFGGPPAAAWQTFRTVVPWQQNPDDRPNIVPGELAYGFMRGNPAAQFMGQEATEPQFLRKQARRLALRTRARSVRALRRGQRARRTVERHAREHVLIGPSTAGTNGG
jgi:histidine ammonia-lyase